MISRVIIADDEPVVLAGLSSLIDWTKEGYEIVAKARNGQVLLYEIERLKPDIVITDIKMPVMDGFDVIESLKDAEDRPSFILLTSFEEFDYVKKAIGLDVVDYIVKLELNRNDLLKALEKAKKTREEKKKILSDNFKGSESLIESFFFRLLFKLNDDEDIKAQAESLALDISFSKYVVSYTKIEISENMDKSQAVALYKSAITLLSDSISRYMKNHIVPLDLSHAAVIFAFNAQDAGGYYNQIFQALRSAQENVRSLFSLRATSSVGPAVDSILQISSSFHRAKVLSTKKTESDEILISTHRQNESFEGNDIDFSQYRERIKKAFEELKSEEIEQVLTDLIENMRNNEILFESAMDISSNVLYMAANLIPECEEMLEEIFRPYSASGYRSLYLARNSSDCITFLEHLEKGLIEELEKRRQDYRMIQINKIQGYIIDNISRKLSLKEVADLFGYSQAYLSSLFSRLCGMSFVDYVTKEKITRAKQMMATSDAKIYSVATSLGFESPFYFSKVFKKVTGLSPSEYIDSLGNTKEK